MVEVLEFSATFIAARPSERLNVVIESDVFGKLMSAADNGTFGPAISRCDVAKNAPTRLKVTLLQSCDSR